jgi:diguanylate cyclase (GGDEF)-like protein/PAS domain S-box-containing protein
MLGIIYYSIMEKQTILKTVRGTLLFIFCLLMAGCVQLEDPPKNPPRVVEGVIDLRDWNFEKNGSIYLEGKWRFFWNELLPPDQINDPIQTEYVSIPDNWTNYDLEGIKFTPEGYATYSLTLYLPDTQQTYGIYNDGQGSAYSLWVDGRLLGQNGQVGTSPQTMTPDKKPITIFFRPDGEKTEIVVQISNFHHRKGGFRNNLILGPAQPIHQFQMDNWFIEAFSVGTLFMMGLYHLFICVFRSKDKAPLYFGLLYWLMAVRTGLTNQSTLLFHLPAISWSFAIRLEYLTFFLGPPLFALFMRSLYPKDVHRWFVRANFGFGIGFSLFMVFIDTLTLSYTATYYQIVFFLGIIYYLFILWRINVKRREGAIPIAFASLITFAAVVFETLYLQNIVEPIQLQRLYPLGQVTTFSFLAYIFVQAILLSSRLSRSFHRIETLSDELEEVNVNLQESEKKYRNIFEDSKDMIFIAGLDSQIEDVSPACEEVLGYTKEELLQMKVQDVIINPAVRSRFQKVISDQGAVRNFEVELRKKDGQKIDALVTATLRHEENGEITGFHGSVRDITARKQAEAERLRALKLEQIAITDPLTKIYNRRFFSEVAENEIERAKRSGSPLSVILFDIDYFKKINDTHGHLAGDQVLINLSNLCQQNLRSMDLFARFGGEEFVILMPDTDSKSAQETAERLRELVAKQPMTTSGKTDISVTISVGISDWNSNNPVDINTLLDRADQALYQSKEAGRNRVSAWGEDAS